jgi:hypothetical protein
MSGDWLRTRYGLPHFFAVENYDPERGEVVESVRVIPGYLALDCLTWGALACLLAAATVPRRA